VVAINYHARPIMILKIDFNKKLLKDGFNQVHIDMAGLKVKDPEMFISIQYGNKEETQLSTAHLMSVRELIDPEEGEILPPVINEAKDHDENKSPKRKPTNN